MFFVVNAVTFQWKLVSLQVILSRWILTTTSGTAESHGIQAAAAGPVSQLDQQNHDATFRPPKPWSPRKQVINQGGWDSPTHWSGGGVRSRILVWGSPSWESRARTACCTFHCYANRRKELLAEWMKRSEASCISSSFVTLIRIPKASRLDSKLIKSVPAVQYSCWLFFLLLGDGIWFVHNMRLKEALM